MPDQRYPANVTALASLPREASVTTVNGINYYQSGSNRYTCAYQGDVVVHIPGGPPPFSAKRLQRVRGVKPGYAVWKAPG